MNKWSLKSWLDADALLIRLAALVALLSIPLKHTHGRLEGFEHILPVSFVATSTVISFGTSIILLYIAAQVRMRRKAA